MKERFFCGYCGIELQGSTVPAERYYHEYESGRSYPYKAFSRSAGERQYVLQYSCPKNLDTLWTRLFGSPHDNYMLEDLYQEDLASGNLKKVE